MKRNLKYISLVTLVALGLVNTANAATSGFYVGADVGADSGTLKANENLSFENQNYTYALTGTLWNAHVGYDFFLSQQAVLGFETFYSRSNAESIYKDNDPTENQTFKQTNSSGVSVLPGWQLNDENRIYARLGWIESTFTHSYANNDLYSPSFNMHRSAIQSGLGYQFNVAQYWTLNFDYTHSNYKAINTTYQTNTFEFQPISNEYTLGMNYYFDAIASETESQPSETTLINNTIYVGASMGMIDARLKQFYSLSTNTASNPYALNGALFNGHVGYRWLIADGIVLGAEIFDQKNTAKMSYQLIGYPTYNYQLKESSSYGGSLLPGYEWNARNLIFARIGSIDSEFSKTGPAQGTGPLFSKRDNGTQLGLGYEVAIFNHFSLTSEYDYATYKTIDTSNINGTYNYKPSDSQYKIGVNYAF